MTLSQRQRGDILWGEISATCQFGSSLGHWCRSTRVNTSPMCCFLFLMQPIKATMIKKNNPSPRSSGMYLRGNETRSIPRTASHTGARTAALWHKHTHTHLENRLDRSNLIQPSFFFFKSVSETAETAQGSSRDRYSGKHTYKTSRQRDIICLAIN